MNQNAAVRLTLLALVVPAGWSVARPLVERSVDAAPRSAAPRSPSFGAGAVDSGILVLQGIGPETALRVPPGREFVLRSTWQRLFSGAKWFLRRSGSTQMLPLGATSPNPWTCNGLILRDGDELLVDGVAGGDVGWSGFWLDRLDPGSRWDHLISGSHQFAGPSQYSRLFTVPSGKRLVLRQLWNAEGFDWFEVQRAGSASRQYFCSGGWRGFGFVLEEGDSLWAFSSVQAGVAHWSGFWEP